jgi:hypothetical protein
MKIFKNAAAQSEVNQFILDFQKIVPSRKYFCEIGGDWSEKLRFITLDTGI